jgi:ubiquinone/menaquinone biosynthesis C-methylase UbiE
VHPGESAIDVGCGTGTVALLATRAGARVTAVDPLGVARSTAEREGLTVQFLAGDAASLPVPDLSMDAVLSNFAAVFAPDPAAAIAEMARVLSPEGGSSSAPGSPAVRWGT